MGVVKYASQLAVVLLTSVLVASCGDDSGKTVADKGMAPAATQGTEAVASGAFSENQKAEIAKMVRETLVSNPEILQEAFAALEKKEQVAQEERKKEALSANAEKLFRSKLSPVAGNPDGDVTIVEFFDYNCPYCRKAFHDLDTVMKSDKNVRVVFKEFPIFGGASMTAAKAALAAEKQGKYFEFHEALLAGEGRVDENQVFEIAAKIGLDVDRLKKDMESKDIAASIAETREVAENLGIRGTPAFFVGDQLIPGAPENLAELLKAKAAEIRKNGCKDC